MRRLFLLCILLSSLLVTCTSAQQAANLTFQPQKHDFKSFDERIRDPNKGSLQDLLEKLTFTDYHAEALRASVTHYLSPDWVPLEKNVAQTHDFHSLSENFFAKLGVVDGTISCVWDQSLNNDSRRIHNKRIFIAANFKDNEHVMPHLLVQLWHTIALLPEGAVFVSIYESSSSDQTGYWLGKYENLLTALKVPHRIKEDGAISYVGHNLVQRIELLQRVRNAALEPLWDSDRDLWRFDEEPLKNARLRKKHSRGMRRLARLPPTNILFTNDVFACARDNLRLLYHDADLACGTDWWVNDDLMTFYDIWVARDITGHKLIWHPPYVEEELSKKRIEKGLHVPVQSCWNGLVALKAAPFLMGLKFRIARPGECFSSECKLICDDLIEMGFSNIVTDPGVRMAYKLEDAVDMFKPDRVRKIQVTDWADIKKSPFDITDFGFNDASQCCPPSENMEYVDWPKCRFERR